MKKTFIISLFLFISLLSYGGGWFLLPKINIRPANCDWNGWEYCSPNPLKMYFEPENKKITIYSKKTQSIIYNELIEEEFKDYVILSGYAVDSDYNVFLLQIRSYKNGTEFISFTYNDGEYMYVVEKIKEEKND